MDTTTQTPQIINTPQPGNTTQPNSATQPIAPAIPDDQKPWGRASLYIISVLLGPGAAFLVSWRNLKRMGKEEEAKQFLKIGGAALLLIVILVSVLSRLPDEYQRASRSIGNLSAIIFPMLLYSKYQKQWELEHPQQTKFSVSIIGWGALGFILAVILVVVAAIIGALIFPG